MRSSTTAQRPLVSPFISESATRRQRLMFALRYQLPEADEILDPTLVKLPGLVLRE